MKKSIISLIFLNSIFTIIAFGQFKEPAGNINMSGFSVCIYATYIASAEIQYDILSSDLFGSNTFYKLNGTYGYGGEITYKLPFNNLDLYVFLSSDYYHVNQNNIPFRLSKDTIKYTVSASENISMYPLEFGVKWDLPQFLESFTFYIGGGGGIYWGKRTRKMLNITMQNLNSKTGFSLNAVAGAEYNINRNFSLDLQLKFREPYFDVESTFNTNLININGTDFEIKSPVTSRITVNGLRLSLGLKYYF